MVSPNRMGWWNKSSCFISSTACKWPKLKKQEGRNSFHEWFSFLPTKNTMPLLVWKQCPFDTQPTSHLSDVLPESRSNPASRAWSIWAVSHKPSDLLPSNLSCKLYISPDQPTEDSKSLIKCNEVPPPDPKQNQQIEFWHLPYSLDCIICPRAGHY